MYSNGYSNGWPLVQPELVCQSVDCSPSSVIAGVSMNVSSNGDGRVTQQVGDGLGLLHE
jgi:hypothetical protein